MYSVTVREHMMIAHSLPDPYFGPAAALHGATYVVDAEFSSEQLNEHNVVVDIALAHRVLKNILGELNYKNLDDLEQFHNQLTTTEYLARYIFDNVAMAIGSGFAGHLKITLNESHVASASFSGDVSS